MAELLRFGRALALALLLFPVGFATHEMTHLVVYTAAGVRAALVVTHWRVGIGSAAIAGVHAAPLGPGGPGAPDVVVPFWLLVANNGLGPLLAAMPLLTLWLGVDRRSRVARAALLANAGVLVFFSAIEMAYPLVERFGNVEADVLLLPGVNYGGALLVLLAVLAASLGRPSRGGHLRVVGSRDASSPGVG